MTSAAATVGPIVQSRYALSRWEVDQAVPALRSREVAAGFCRALLRQGGSADAVREHRIRVLALPMLPVPVRAGVSAVALVTPRDAAPGSGQALGDAIREIGRDGFRVKGRRLWLRKAKDRAYDLHRWVGPSRVWTTVTPCVAGIDGWSNLADKRRRQLMELMATELVVGDVRGTTTLDQIVEGTQTHEEAWVPGIPPASAWKNPMGAKRAAHVRLTFRSPVEGPLVLGGDRLLGMGLLVPVDLAKDKF